VAADFLAAPNNEAALAWLDRVADWPDGRLVVWGEPGSGKTHLLHRWAERQRAVLWSGPSLHARALPVTCGVAVDDADESADEIALLHLINACKEAGQPLLLTGRPAPARWPVRLPDLASRLRATTTVQMGAADDDLLQALLARLFADRQLAVSAPVQAFLLARLPRNGAALREAVARLDRAALMTGRAVTRPLAASVLTEMEQDRDISESTRFEISQESDASR
jgi:chromosomal replication initiation ATPase DnaA